MTKAHTEEVTERTGTKELWWDMVQGTVLGLAGREQGDESVIQPREPPKKERKRKLRSLFSSFGLLGEEDVLTDRLDERRGSSVKTFRSFVVNAKEVYWGCVHERTDRPPSKTYVWRGLLTRLGLSLYKTDCQVDPQGTGWPARTGIRVKPCYPGETHPRGLILT